MSHNPPTTVQRRGDRPPRGRPVTLAIAGDSAAGKTTLTKGLVHALGAERITAICGDDYHRSTGVSARRCRSPPFIRTATTSR